jgi:hypothetical protein
MSLSLTLTEAIDEVIKTFITRVSNKYNLDNTELTSIWKGESNNQKVVKTTKTKQVETNGDHEEIDPDVLLKCNKAELVALCKSHGHKCSGSKSILMNRLLGKEKNDVPVKSSKSKANKVCETKATPVAKKLTANIPNILIRRNQYNNYEHPETGLLFDNETKVVIGKQNNDGTVEPLTEGDIDQCNAFKFKFNIPSNLDHKSTLIEVKVDELSEDEDDDEDLNIDDDEDLDEEEIEDDILEEDLLEDDLLEDDDEFEEYVSDED